MKRKSVLFRHSHITTLLMLTVVSVTSLLFVVVRNYPYLNTVTVQSIVVTKSLDSFKIDKDGQHLQSPAFSDDLLEEDEEDRYKRARKPIEYARNRKYPKDTKVAVSQSKFKNSETRNSDKMFENSKLQNSDERFITSKIRNSHEKCVKRLPQAIIVGIQKSGTTALLQFLSGHPQIAACLHPVETKYFSQYFRKPLSWYRNLMPCSFSNQVTIEKSPPYFYRRYCAVGIRKMNPTTKIIIIVKDPINRALSMHTMMKGKNNIGRMPFADAVSFKTHNTINGHCPYIDFSNYPKYMKAWLDNFKLEQILVLDGNNLEQDPAQELNKVEDFLGIDTYFTRDRFVFNKGKGKYCFKSDESKIECLGKNKGRNHAKINNEIKDKLQRYFKPKNIQFFRMINRKFDWGY